MTGREARHRGLTAKWRPSLRLVLVLVLGTVLALPMAGLFAFRIYDSQLIRQTEAELVAQTAVLVALAQREIGADVPADVPLDEAVPGYEPTTPGLYRPLVPALDLATTPALPPRPDARVAERPAEPVFKAIGERLMPILLETQRVTLAGFRLLDPRGVVIAGRDEQGMSLAHVEEVDAALHGIFSDRLRLRISKHASPPLGSISRGTPVRVFIAMPIIVRQHVAGVIYASRTPSDIVSGLFALRRQLGLAAASVVFAAALIGVVLYRTISVPVRDLVGLTDAIGAGDREAIRSRRQHGTVEFAALSHSFRAMTARLNQRGEAISIFAAHVSHELKSPLTAIRGAAELLLDDAQEAGSRMHAEDRRRFLDHIVADTTRLDTLLQRLRDLAHAKEAPSVGTTAFRPVIDALRSATPGLDIVASGDIDEPVRLSAENARTFCRILPITRLATMRHGSTFWPGATAR